MKSQLIDVDVSSEVRSFAMRALTDFGLLEAFEDRPAWEREQCLQWLDGAAGEREQECRVSRLLDDLYLERPLAGAALV